MACEGPDVGEAAHRWADSDLVAASSVSLKPTSDIGSWNVTARGDVTFGQKKIPTPFRNAAPNLSAADSQ
jgi:hypothetical protein